MKMMKKTTLLLLLAVNAAHAQFTCPLSASDEEGCLAALDDDGSHCVWCSVSGFGLCMNEATAEAFEQAMQAQCDRYSGDDDTEPAADDDKAPPPPPKTDDSISPNDDTMPDNFWMCLQHKNAKDCAGDDCTWCTSKAGWGLWYVFALFGRSFLVELLLLLRIFYTHT